MSAPPKPFCRRCGRPKPPGQGRKLCDDCAASARSHRAQHLAEKMCHRCGRRRRVPEEISRTKRTCRACARERRRAYNRRWNREHRERASEAQRRYYASIRRDPVRYRRYLDEERIDYRLRQERRGRALWLVPAERYSETNKHWNIDPAPIAKAVRRWIIATGEPIDVLATRARVSARLVDAHLCAQRRTITVDAADKLAVAIGLHLDVIYEEVA